MTTKITKTDAMRLWDLVKGHLGADVLVKVARGFPELAKEANGLANEKKKLNDEFQKYLAAHKHKSHK
jgi:hypothetical protein